MELNGPEKEEKTSLRVDDGVDPEEEEQGIDMQEQEGGQFQ